MAWMHTDKKYMKAVGLVSCIEMLEAAGGGVGGTPTAPESDALRRIEEEQSPSAVNCSFQEIGASAEYPDTPCVNIFKESIFPRSVLLRYNLSLGFLLGKGTQGACGRVFDATVPASRFGPAAASRTQPQAPVRFPCRPTRVLNDVAVMTE